MNAPATRDTGTVVRWLAARGFGWIAPDAGGRGAAGGEDCRLVAKSKNIACNLNPPVQY